MSCPFCNGTSFCAALRVLSFPGLIHLKRPISLAALAAALLITLYGGLLRLDAFTGRYGPLDRPAWARVVTHDVAPLARHLRPSTVVWGREPRPYVGGDPIAYLKYAREMTSFYQPHVREPVFLATTRLALWALCGQDAAVSLASAAGSVLAILATYLLGAALISPVGGLAAAALMAIEYNSITWAVDGWRDDTFTAAFLLSAWALVRFRERASFGSALLVGFTAGAACLTRITALSFILPALLWIVAAGGTARRERLIHAATALLIMTALVAPFLVSCAIATGDPFYSINAHTTYYRFTEGLPIEHPMSAAEYIRLKFARHPIAAFDVGINGLFVEPFYRKWNLFDIWVRHLGTVLSWGALIGLAMWPFSARGRLMLVILLGSLVPYAFTWNIGGGNEWRFTMHVLPIFIIAATEAVAGAMGVVRTRPAMRPLVLRAAAVAAVAAIAVASYVALPWFTAKEAIASGEAVTIEAGDRGRVFYRRGWSRTHAEGLVNVRVSREARTSVHIPLPEKRRYEVVLRLDPVAPDRQDRVAVLFNGQLAGRIRLSWDPQRVGSHRIPLPVEWVKIGDNEITLVPETTVSAGSAGSRFAWLDPADTIGVRMWYVRVLE
jgi:dolichyl-phosphate-mannose-protein mannosyltransferase